MYYYFSSSVPAIVKLNGIYFGEIYNTVKFINADSSCFVEVCPLGVSIPQTNFLTSEDFLLSPPYPLSVTDMGGGYLIKYSPIISNESFRVINQGKFNGALFTCFIENGYKLTIETPFGVYTENLDFEFSNVSFSPFYDCFDYYVVVFKGKKTVVSVYCLKGETKKVLSFITDQFDLENMTATTRFQDIAKHTLVERLILDGEIKKERVSLTQEKTLSVYNVHEKIVPFCMLEELILSGKVSEFLIGNVLDNKDRLKDFFGNFIGVMPPPFFRKENEVGLIYANGDRKYKVEYYLFEYQNKKICGIKKV